MERRLSQLEKRLSQLEAREKRSLRVIERQQRVISSQQRRIVRLEKRRAAPRVSVYRKRTTGVRPEHGGQLQTRPATTAEKEQPVYVQRFQLLPHDARKTDYRGTVAVALKRPWSSMTEAQQQAVLHRVGQAVRNSGGSQYWVGDPKYGGLIAPWELAEMAQRRTNVLIQWS
jgi:type II secretory pathway component PulJ